MQLSQFRIQNFRSIIDSGWVKIEDIAVLVGKNEAGKTSLLKALWKFNPFKEEPYSLDREWPRGRRKEKSPDKPVATVHFNFSSDELNSLLKVDEGFKGVTGVEIVKSYSGAKTYNFLPSNVLTNSWIDRESQKIISTFSSEISANSLKNISEAIKTATQKVNSPSAMKQFKVDVTSLRDKLESFCDSNSLESDKPKLSTVTVGLNKLIELAAGDAPRTKAIAFVESVLPKFIYMDDHKVFAGSAFLNQVKERKDNNRLNEEDRTIILIMEMAGLNLEEEVAKGSAKDKEQRMLDMNDASQTLTNEISKRWSQKQYEVMFQADGHHFMTFVKDAGGSALVPLEERSKGFQWFFCFDMTFMYETNGQFENAIILLDEPGLHLHPDAQRDLLERFKSYSKKNQLIYSTHLPFMIDCKRLDNVWIAEELTNEGSRVHQNWESADKDARFTLQAALGLSWSQSLFVGQYNLIVEGVTDYTFINSISDIFHKAGKRGLDSSYVLTYAGGASKVAYIGTLLNGQKLNVAALLDSDSEGQAAFQQLAHQKILSDKQVFLLGDILNKTQCASEDLFSVDYYVQQAQEVYKRELNGKAITLKTGNQAIVEKLEEFFKASGINFNKGRVANKIKEDLSKKTYEALPKETIQNFEALFAALNKLVDTWKGLELATTVKDSKESSKRRGRSQEVSH